MTHQQQRKLKAIFANHIYIIGFEIQFRLNFLRASQSQIIFQTVLQRDTTHLIRPTALRFDFVLEKTNSTAEATYILLKL